MTKTAEFLEMQKAGTGKPLKALILSAFPFQHPRNGVQVRLAKIAECFRGHGISVDSIAVYDPDEYDVRDAGDQDIALPEGQSWLGKKYGNQALPFVRDCLAADFAASDHGGYREILSRIPASVDIIHLEQPWLLPLVQRLRQEVPGCRNACLIYGSQNIEAPLRQAILSSHGVHEVDDLIQHISRIERSAAIEADLVLAVTANDLKMLQQFGAENVLLVPNGVSSSPTNTERIEYWRERLPVVPWLLYIGSSYSPNYTGFVSAVGDSLRCFPPASRLVVVGSVGPYLKDLLMKSSDRYINRSRLEILGVLDDQDLAAVKMLAHGYLLPIQEGGGSSLKAAEALYSGKYVISTPIGLRGFEQFASLPEVAIACSPDEFQAAIKRVLLDKHVDKPFPLHQDLRKRLLWEHCLAALPDRVTDVLKRRDLGSSRWYKQADCR